MKVSVLMLMAVLLNAVDAPTEIPAWTLVGILAKETKSYYGKDGAIVYVDKRVGSAGEHSAFQITPKAWKQVKRTGEHYSEISTDQSYAEDIAIRYLCWLYVHSAKGNWYRAVEYYNGGPGNRSKDYLTDVIKLATKAGYNP